MFSNLKLIFELTFVCYETLQVIELKPILIHSHRVVISVSFTGKRIENAFQLKVKCGDGTAPLLATVRKICE